MNFLKIKLPAIIAALIILGGCASITGTRNQPVSITTNHKGNPITGCHCELTNNKGTWHVKTPGSVVIQKSYGDLSITCTKSNQYVGTGTFKSASEGAVFGNIIAGGLIGYAVDANSGAGFSYPSTMNINLVKKTN